MRVGSQVIGTYSEIDMVKRQWSQIDEKNKQKFSCFYYIHTYRDVLRNTQKGLHAQVCCRPRPSLGDVEPHDLVSPLPL